MPAPSALLGFAALGLLAAVGHPTAQAAIAVGTGRVMHRERADGVHPDLLWLLDEWERDGTHVVEIAGGPNWSPPGGLRTNPAEQSAAAAGGLSNASTLASTPHGRGAALDVWPYGFNPHRSYDAADQLPDAHALMMTFADFAAARGFVVGRDFKTPDDPHVELANWVALPFPPPDYRGA